MATAAPPRRPSRKQAEPQNDDEFENKLTELERYQSVFGEITRFVDVIRQGEKELEEAKLELAQAKAAMEAAKDRVTEINDYRDAAKHGLLRYLDRGKEILPLFDQMDPSDDEVHGEHSTEWRSEPVTALKLSLTSQIALSEAEIMLVGQLQDRVLQEPQRWWEKVPGLSLGIAAAIVDRLNDFISERSGS